jgi:hypothetical protein
MTSDPPVALAAPFEAALEAVSRAVLGVASCSEGDATD